MRIGKVISKNEEVWGGVVRYLENKVEFIQKVKKIRSQNKSGR